MTITVIGSGKVGASIAINCTIRDLDNVLLLDIIKGLPQGEALDINHQLSERGIDRIVRGSNNYEDMSGSEVVVLVAGVGRKPGMTRMDLLNTNAGIVKEVTLKIKRYIREDTIIIIVTNPLDPMTYLTLKMTKMGKNKVIGMGGMLDLSRFKSFVHDALNVSRDSIHAMVIGEHGENMLPLTRFCSISGIPLFEFVSKEKAQEIFEDTKKTAAEVIALKGATIFAPGNAVASMIESVIKNKNSVMPVSTLLQGEYGVDDVCIGIPAVIGRNGVEKIIELKLDSKEQDLFNGGIKSVKEAIKALPL